MHQRKYSEDDPSFAASLRRFEKLTLEEQLPILAFVLREELNASARALPRSRQRVQTAPAATARAPLLVVPAAKPPPPAVAPALARTPPTAASIPAPAPSVPAVAAPVSATALVPALPAPVAAMADLPALPTPPAAPAKLRIIEAELLPDPGVAPISRAAKRRTNSLVPGPADASGPRARSIAATIAIIFPLAVALMLWHAPTLSPVPAGEVESRQSAVVVAAEPSRPRPFTPAPAAQPSPTVYAPKPVQGGSTARVQDPHAMPVTLYFRRRGFHTDPADRRKINWYMEGRLTNLSEIPMNIEVRAESLGMLSTSQIQIDVAPHTERDFGVDDGLEMHPGDKVTLMSAPYSDMVVGGVH